MGIGDLAPADHGRGLDRELVVSLTTPASSAAVVVITLNVEPGGWGAEKAIPASASTEPVARVEHRDAAVLAAERRDRGLLEVGVDRGVHGLARDGLAARRAPLLAGVGVSPPAGTASSSPPGWPASRG